ncbi:MAG: hypothetical protein NXI04_22355 [Planctomycetaceae bacterium]|nr:hypothetical protein [Planctomycetaceae bacterium]
MSDIACSEYCQCLTDLGAKLQVEGLAPDDERACSRWPMICTLSSSSTRTSADVLISAELGHITPSHLPDWQESLPAAKTIGHVREMAGDESADLRQPDEERVSRGDARTVHIRKHVRLGRLRFPRRRRRHSDLQAFSMYCAENGKADTCDALNALPGNVMKPGVKIHSDFDRFPRGVSHGRLKVDQRMQDAVTEFEDAEMTPEAFALEVKAGGEQTGIQQTFAQFQQGVDHAQRTA